MKNEKSNIIKKSKNNINFIVPSFLNEQLFSYLIISYIILYKGLLNLIIIL